MIKEVTGNKLFFAKVKPNAIIPTKANENAGYDIYPCFEEDYIVISPLETKLIPTGIATAMSEDYYAQIQERGSTGSKGIKYGAGVIDSSYRGEWFIPITNCNQSSLIIKKENVTLPWSYGNYKVYPYEKAIAQFVILPVPKMEVEEILLEDLQNIKSNRGNECLGSSGK